MKKRYTLLSKVSLICVIVLFTLFNCHEWVCDGFSEYISPCDGIYQYFHINWGWHEEGSSTDLNGWFGFFYWNTPGRYYRYAYDAIVDIHP